MTRDEVKVVMKAMTELYPNYKPNDLTAAVNAWAAVLKYDNAKDIQKALIKYSRTDTSGFAPTVGQLVQLAMPDTSGDWLLVRQALTNSSYHAEEEFAALPERVQRIVGTPETLKQWARTDTTIVDTSIAKAFREAERGINGRMEGLPVLRNEISGQDGKEQTDILQLSVRSEQ